MSGSLTPQETYDILVELEEKISLLREDAEGYNSPEMFKYIEQFEEYEKIWFEFSEQEKSNVLT